MVTGLKALCQRLMGGPRPGTSYIPTSLRFAQGYADGCARAERRLSEDKRGTPAIQEALRTCEQRLQDMSDNSTAVEKALLESEACFRSLFEHSADAITLFDPETGRFVEANEAAAQQIGAPSREAVRNLSPAGIAPERQPDGQLSSEKAAEMIQTALTQGSHRFEWVARRYDGSEFPLDIVLTAIPFRERTLLFAVSREISAHKRAESQIRQLNASLETRVAERTIELVQSNQQLKHAQEEFRKRSDQVQKHRDVLLELARSDKSDLHRALQRICSLSAATLNVARVSYWSVRQDDSAISCEVLYLRETEDFDGQSKGSRLGFADYPTYFEELAANRPIVANHVLTHPATRGLAENYLKPSGISSVLDAPVWECGEGVGVLRHEHIGPDRAWTAEEIDFVTALASMVSLALEESNRARSEQLLRKSEARLRESEERFSTAFRASPALISLLRLSDGKFVEVNDAFARWLGLDRDSIVGHDTQELNVWLNRDDREKFLADLRRNGSVREVERQFRSRRGTLHTIVFSAEIIEINREPHVLGFGIDITQRKQAEVELRRTLAREKELGQLRSYFVSMVSHEFRTPLGILQSSAEILEDYLEQLEPAERKNHLQSIRNNTRRMARIMEEVLLIGSFDAGRMEFKPASLELGTFARRLVEEVLSATAHRCPIELVLAGVPAGIQADERLLQHIFANLLTNAVKYSDPGQVVRFEFACTGQEIVCAVRDQGIGIPEADKEWLFNPFHRGRNVDDRPGTGLGLVIVKRCVDLHGGEIEMESKFGEGTVATVRLPYEKDHGN
jgi:PAS domain S-box-containing protein